MKIFTFLILILLFFVFQNILIIESIKYFFDQSKTTLNSYDEGLKDGYYDAQLVSNPTNATIFFIHTLKYSVFNNSLKQKGYIDGYLQATNDLQNR